MKQIYKESELRQATVMFADISGFTSMSEKMSPEEITSLINQCFDLIGKVTERHEGHIDKFIGDCAMILFGVPTAIEHAQLKAVNAAIEIRNEIRLFNSEMDLSNPLDVHIGINSGPVLAGTVGSSGNKEFTVMGDTVNLASRLEDLSESGQILVGDSTYKLTMNDFKYCELKPVKIKGKEKPVNVFELLSIREQNTKFEMNTERMIQSEMIGRDQEFNKLELQVHKVIDGDGGIVSIVGEAGIGKSRLIAELKKERSMCKVLLLEGRALSVGANLSFHPIIDILKIYANISEQDSAIVAANKLESAIKKALPDDTTEIFPFIATLMGMKLSGTNKEIATRVEGEGLEKQILKSLKILISKLAELDPLIIIIEDMHWADLSTIELLESLFRLTENNRLLIINLFRPNYNNTGTRIEKKLQEDYSDFHTYIKLSPLDANSSTKLIYNLLKITGLSSSMREIIKNRSEGNPFFIEEVIRSFIDEGIVEFIDGKFQITDKINSVVIPYTIQELLISRIDRLDEETKSLLKMAAVIGRNFFYKILNEVAFSINDIDKIINYLKEIQLIREGKRFDEIEYLFKHALAQEAIYESLLLQKRKDLHLKVAISIEKVFTNKLHEFYGMLAYHFSNGEDLDRAEEYMLKAGEEAMKSSASVEALQYYQEALKLYQNKPGETADLEKIALMNRNIALALFYKGRNIESVEYFDRVTDYYGFKMSKNAIIKKINILFKLIFIISSLYFPLQSRKKIAVNNDNDLVFFLAQKLHLMAIAIPDRGIEVGLILYSWLLKFNLYKFNKGAAFLSILSVMFSYFGISFKLSRKVLDFLKDKIDRENVNYYIYYEFAERMHNYLEGNWDEVGYDDESIKSYLKISQFNYFGYYINLYSYIVCERGNFSEAIKTRKYLFEVVALYDIAYLVYMNDSSMAKILMKFRKSEEALSKISELIVMLLKYKNDLYLFSTYAYKSRVQLSMDDLSGAAISLQKSLELKSKISLPFHLTDFYTANLLYNITIFENSLKTNDKSKISDCRKSAYNSSKEALAITKKIVCDRVEIYKLLGTFYWLNNKQKKAHLWWDRSIKEGLKLGAKLELSRTYFEIGKRLKASKRADSDDYLLKARDLFIEMDLQWDLKQLDLI